MFKKLAEKVEAQFAEMQKSGKLYIVNVSGDTLWNCYLESFDKENDPVFRDPNSTTHTCNNDKNFIRRYGNVVSIKDGKIITMWDIELQKDDIYYNSCKNMSELLKSSKICDVFIEEFNFLHKANYEKTNKNQALYRISVEKSLKQYTKEEVLKFGVVQENKVYTFYHFTAFLKKEFVNFSNSSIEAIKGNLRTNAQLLSKGLTIPLETLELVRDLIQQDSLLRGDIYLQKVLDFIKVKKEYQNVESSLKELWIWQNCENIQICRFANELIGTTAIELAEGKDINKVCKDFNYRIDPVNYNKAKSPITPAMYELAEKEINALGYENSFERRFATIDDIDISEIKHSNINNTVEKPVGLFAKAGVPTKSEINRHKRAEFDKVETVSIEKFMEVILPTAESVEVLLENKHQNNLVSLFTTVNKNNKNLLKWSNPFSWTYNGNLSGKSMIKENVKAVGGKTTGILRCSLQWNDEDTKGNVDYDLHCQTPKDLIFYQKKGFETLTGGILDVDMIRPTKIGIENITWQKKLPDGNYEFIVDTFCNGNNTGFKVEIEFDGNTFNYHHNSKTSYKSKTKVATISVINGVMSITHHLPETSSSKSLWNLETNQFHKVNLVCTSPNHWGDNNVGTKEYFFMLQDCKTPEAMRAFHVDQLNSELMSVRKAIDILGNFKRVEPSDKQLSGLGFNATVRDELIVKVKGSHQRVLKITF